jgi:hypothetical protein
MGVTLIEAFRARLSVRLEPSISGRKPHVCDLRHCNQRPFPHPEREVEVFV